MDIKGKITEVGPTQQVTDSLKKRELILEYAENPQYPEYLRFECIQDKCDLLNNLSAGQEVEVFFNLKGRKWTDKTGKDVYFNTLQLWKLNVLERGGAVPEVASSPDDDFPF